MPPQNRLDQAEAVRLLVESRAFFGDLPDYKNGIWKKLSIASGGKWTAHNWYISTKENRRQIWTQARVKMGLSPSIPRTEAEVNNESISSESQDDKENDTEEDSDDGRPRFDLILTSEEWNQIKPVESDGKRSTNTLKPRVWTNVIQDAFWRQFRLPCAFMFKRGEINVSEQRQYFLKIQGKCSSKKCGNTFNGTADCEPPPDSGLIVRVRTRDTTYDDHEPVKRPLNGVKRKHIGDQAIGEGCHNLQKRLRRQNLRPGETDGPTIPSLDALRHAKKEASTRKFGGQQVAGEDLIQTIYRLKYQSPYTGSIHDVGYSPFHVIYGTIEQRAVYKQYRRQYRKYSSLCIDSTASLVRKIVTPTGLKTATIFLYSLVLHFHKTSVSIFQMLSESQETENITYFLRTWLRTVDNLKPIQIVMDGSRALLRACSLAFNDMPIQLYNSICFNAVRKNEMVPKELISTFIRLDVAHYLHNVVDSASLRSHPIPAVRDFFIRCVSLMIDCQSFIDFLHIFILTCVVAYQQHDDSLLKLKSTRDCIRTPMEAKTQLELMIKKRPLDSNDYLKLFDSTDDGNGNVKPNGGEKDPESMSDVRNFCEGLKAESKAVSHEGTSVNYYFLPKFGDQLIVMAREFPLWSAVCIPYFTTHPTSSYVERIFSEIKNEVFRNYKLPQNVDNFLKIHLTDLLEGVPGLRSQLREFQIKGNKIPDPKNRDIPKDEKSEVHDSDAGGLNDVQTQQNSKFHSKNGKKTYTSDSFSLPPDDPLDDSDWRSRENWRGKADPYVRFKAEALDDSEYHADGVQNSSTETGSWAHQDLNNNVASARKFHTPNTNLSYAPQNTKSQSPTHDGQNSELASDVPSPKSRAVANRGHRTSIPDHQGADAEYRASGTDILDGSIPEAPGHIETSLPVYTNEIPTILIPDTSPPRENIFNSHSLRVKTDPSQSKYFRSYPEIVLNRVTEETVNHKKLFRIRKNKENVLLNGNQCGTILIENVRYCVRNTCPFDSITSVLFTSLLDDADYYSFIKEMIQPNETTDCGGAREERSYWDFLYKFLNEGTSKELYVDRFLLLKPIYEATRVTTSVSNQEILHSYNAFDSPIEVWMRLMKSAPTALRTRDCEECGEILEALTSFIPDHQMIIREGFEVLQKALKFHPKIHNYQCRQCGNFSERDTVTSGHVFIELDIRLKSSGPWKTCRLKNFPLSLDFPRRYRLAGILCGWGGHFTAICRRASGRWEEYNDLGTHVGRRYGNDEITPIAALYILDTSPIP